MKIEVKALQKVKLDPGDVLILQAEHPFPAEAVEDIARVFPDNKVLVTEDNIAIKVVKP